MAARAGGVPGRRRLDAGARPCEFLAGAVPDVPDSGLAGGRVGRWPTGRRAHGRGRRLVVRLRVFRGRPLLDRQRPSGRRQDIRLAVAVRRHRAAGRARSVYRPWGWAGASDVGARARPCLGARGRAHGFGMAAWPSAHRVSLERLRVCLGFPAAAGAGRRLGRHLGPDVSGGRGLCESPPCSPTIAPIPEDRGWRRR